MSYFNQIKGAIDHIVIVLHREGFTKAEKTQDLSKLLTHSGLTLGSEIIWMIILLSYIIYQ